MFPRRQEIAECQRRPKLACCNTPSINPRSENARWDGLRFGGEPRPQRGPSGEQLPEMGQHEVRVLVQQHQDPVQGGNAGPRLWVGPAPFIPPRRRALESEAAHPAETNVLLRSSPPLLEAPSLQRVSEGPPIGQGAGCTFSTQNDKPHHWTLFRAKICQFELTERQKSKKILDFFI